MNQYSWVTKRAEINEWRAGNQHRYEPDPQKLLESALAYAKLGRPVFPVKYIRPDGVCSCGKDPCGNIKPFAPHGDGAGKHPDTPNGFKDATTDEDQIRAWWHKHPHAHIGLLVLPGELVIDIDDRAGGNDTFKNVMQVQYPAFPDTPHAFTGGKGHHFFFSLPDGPARSLPASGNVTNFAGIEWKANGGGYVVAAPSGHLTGGEYVWEVDAALLDVPTAPIPAWLLALVLHSGGKAQGFSVQGLGPAIQGKGAGPSWTWDEVIGFFRRTYPTGARRVATGLPRLVGILQSRGHVPEDLALEFLLDWQETHFAPPLDLTDLTAQVQAMYARWRPQTDAVSGEAFLRRLCTGVASLPPDVPTSRNTPLLRDVGTSLEQDTPMDLEQEAPPPSVARQAAALAGLYRDAAIRLFPRDPGTYVKGGSKAMRRKDDHKHIVIHAGSSETWSEPGNAIYKRQKVFQFYSPLLWDIVERQNKGAIYHYRRHLSPETVLEDARYTSNLHSRIRRHHGNYVDFTILEGDGWWIHTFADYDDRSGDTEPTVAAQEDFENWLQGLGPPDDEYHRRYPVMASQEWKMPKSRTNEWEAVGSRSTPDITRYREIEDREDCEAAEQRHILTWVATEAEVMGRAPDDIVYTRHFKGGEDQSAKSMLAFLKNDLGFFLYPKAMAELEAPEPNTAPWDHSGQAPAPPKQARFAV